MGYVQGIGKKMLEQIRQVGNIPTASPVLAGTSGMVSENEVK